MAEHTAAAIRDRIRSRLAKPMPRSPIAQTAEQMQLKELRDALMMQDPNFDYSGVPSASFRAQLSLLDTPEEREWWLNKRVGQYGWAQDRTGKYALTPAGMKRLGLPGGDKPVVIDEPGITRRDLADIAGSMPAVVGGTGAAIASTGVGFAPGVAIAGLGAGVGKLIGELAEQAAGMNIQSAPEVAADAVEEVGLSMLGEGVIGRPLGWMGRRVVAPYASRMPAEARTLAQEAAEFGVKPKAVQLHQPPTPLLSRYSSLMDMILGDPLAKKNLAALQTATNRLAGRFGPSKDASKVGADIVKDIGDARAALSKWADGQATAIDSAVRSTIRAVDKTAEEQPFIPTSVLKDAAESLLKSLPKAKGGKKVILSNSALVAQLDSIINDLPHFQTLTQMLHLTKRLWDAVDDDTIVPGITARDAKALWAASIATYDDVADPQLRNVLLSFREQYKNQIRKFDTAFVKRVMLDPKYATHLPPEKIASAVFQKGGLKNMEQIKRVVSPETWTGVQRASMEEILSNLVTRSDRPLEYVFQGKAFLDQLDKYGRETLVGMFGREMTNDLYKLGRVTQLVTQRMKMSGGIAAASMALHPIHNFPWLVRLRILSRAMATKPMIKWLTEGFELPNTARGTAALARAGAMLAVLADEHTRDQVNMAHAAQMQKAE